MASSRIWMTGVLLSFALASVSPASAEAPFSFENTPGKLPKDVKPLAYRIELAPDLDALSRADGGASLSFDASEEVDIESLKPLTSLVVNAIDLEFSRVSLDGKNATKIDIDAKEQTATFHFDSTFAPGAHVLNVAYKGKISPQPVGFYYTAYGPQADRRRMLTTQFEPADARRMFPGWDEPVFKSRFTLSAILPETFHAISNMPVARKELVGAGKTRVVFDQTPAMSSYLLVLVAGELDTIGQKIAGVDVAVNAPRGRVEQGRFALEVMGKILPYYNDYFGTPYPLPKLDLIAVPDFNAGAMENWGGITYLDSRLLFDPQNSAEQTREVVFEIVAHEMAHQWSGDLVTMAWWDNLWLNEGFASWMQKKSTDHFNPGWKTWLRAHASKEAAMGLDARATSHPIQQKIDDESKAESAFDVITYQKGQAFIRMLEAYIGEDAFRQGMRAYMKAHAYSSTTTADLWKALEDASGKPVSQIASGFTEHAGIPLIKVSVYCSDGKTTATLSQSRFTIANPYADTVAWQIPVIIGLGGGGERKTILLGGDPQTVEFSGCDKPVKANYGGLGYYRVRYDDVGRSMLHKYFTRLPAADRVNILADSWAMVKAASPADAKDLSAQLFDYLNLTKLLKDETEYVVWQSVIGTLLEIDNLERGAKGRTAFRVYARDLLRPVLERLGWDAKPNATAGDPDIVQLRTAVIDALGRFGEPLVVDEARRRFAAFLKDPATLAPDLRGPVASVVGYWADQETYDNLRQLGRKATGTEDLLRYYLALAGAGHPALIAQTIDIAAETEELPKGQINGFLGRAAGASDNPDAVWSLVFSDEKRSKIFAKISPDKQNRLLPQIASATANPEVAFQLKWAEPSRRSDGARYEAAKAIEGIEFKAEFVSQLLPEIDKWLEANR